MVSTRLRLTQLLVVWMAVTAVIFSTTACTKKNRTNDTAPAPEAPVDPSQPAPNGSELDSDTSQSSQVPVGHDAGSGEPVENSVDIVDFESDEDSAFEASALPVPSVAVLDPTGMLPDQIYAYSDKQGPAGTTNGVRSGLASRDGTPLYYSGAGQDNLPSLLKRVLESEKNPARKQRNKEFAKRVSAAAFEVTDWYSRTAQASVTLQRDGKTIRYKFQNRFDNRLRMRAGDLKRSPFVEIETACMNVDGDCQTVHMIVRDASKGETVTAHVIVRRSTVALHIEGNGYGRAGNPEYDRFLKVLLNTVRAPKGLDNIQDIAFTTSEVIGGQSQFTVAMDAVFYNGTRQVIAWTGPLVKPKDSSFLNVEAYVIPYAMTVQGRAVDSPNLIINSFRETRLVRNDGRGNIQLEVTIRKATPRGSEDTVRLTFARIHKQVGGLVLP